MNKSQNSKGWPGLTNLIIFGLAALIALLTISCKVTSGTSAKTAKTYVLIHGAYHGKWCWQKVTPLLEAKGHRVIAIDLPGHGEDPTPVKEVTLYSYTDKVCEVLDEIDGAAILVGHSLGGMPISTAAESRPEKVRALVYLTAILPKDGETVFSQPEDPNPSGIPFAVVLRIKKS